MIREREIKGVGERRERQERGERRKEGETCMGIEGQRETERDQEGSCHFFYNRIVEVIYHHSIACYRSNPVMLGRGLRKVCEYEEAERI